MDLSEISTEKLKDIFSKISFELKKRQSSVIVDIAAKKYSIKSANRFENDGGLTEDVFIFNSSNILSMPVNKRETFDEKRVYLRCILAQDWSFLFQNYEDESKNFYVYAHLDPRNKSFACKEINVLPCNGMPFYIGKGTGNRAYDLKRNQGHGKAISTLLNIGFDQNEIVRILFDGISERSSMEIESKLIYFFGTIYEEGRKGILLNLDISKRPVFIGSMHRYISNKAKKNIRKKEESISIEAAQV